MEKLQVDNFLVIKHADFDVGRINVIIGSQASGKSVLAKLLYFFRKFLSTTYLESIKSFDLKKDVEKKALIEFEKYFPKYAWIQQQFNIKYIINNFIVSISRSINNNGKIYLKFNYSKDLIYLHKKLKNSYNKKLKEIETDNLGTRNLQDIYHQVIKESVFYIDIKNNFNISLFIPANRSFFATLQKNVFSFLANNIEIDPFHK